MSTYLKLVPLDAVIQCRTDGGLDEHEAYANMKRVTELTFAQAIQMLNDINWGKFHPDVGFLITYNNCEVMPILDEGDRTTGMAIDACAPENEWEMVSARLLAPMHEKIGDIVKDYGDNFWAVFKDEEMVATIYKDANEHVADISYYEVDEY